jgi:hypothetical protein
VTPGHDAPVYGAEPVHVVGRRHLVQNERSTGRAQDQIDADLLDR